MVKSSVSVSGPVAWSIIGRSNATIVQKDGEWKGIVVTQSNVARF